MSRYVQQVCWSATNVQGLLLHLLFLDEAFVTMSGGQCKVLQLAEPETPQHCPSSLSSGLQGIQSQCSNLETVTFLPWHCHGL
jgi:hypothetical protein